MAGTPSQKRTSLKRQESQRKRENEQAVIAAAELKRQRRIERNLKNSQKASKKNG